MAYVNGVATHDNIEYTVSKECLTSQCSYESRSVPSCLLLEILLLSAV